MIVTPPPGPAPIRFEVVLSQSWTLFRRNWIVALPPVIALLISLVAFAALAGAIVSRAIAHGAFQRHAPSADGGFVGMVLGGMLLSTIVVLGVSLWSYAAIYGMADAVWTKGSATFADGFTAFRTRAGALIVAGIGVAGLAIVAFILALPTLGVSVLAVPLVTMYVAPSVVSGRRDGFTAIAESYRLVRRFFGTSGITLLVLLGINYGISTLASLPLYPLEFAFLPSVGQTTPRMPPVGLLLAVGCWFVFAMIVAQAYLGYYTIAIVGLYRAVVTHPGAGEPPGPVTPVVPA